MKRVDVIWLMQNALKDYLLNVKYLQITNYEDGLEEVFSTLERTGLIDTSHITNYEDGLEEALSALEHAGLIDTSQITNYEEGLEEALSALERTGLIDTSIYSTVSTSSASTSLLIRCIKCDTGWDSMQMASLCCSKDY
jgi:hypothetical protein